MLNVDEIKTAIEWLMENKSYKLFKWCLDTFGGMETKPVVLLMNGEYEELAKEMMKYSESLQFEIVELMY